ncbi:MAG: hypothetical protein ABIP72_05600 [Acidimicrobiales bacterium]
MADWTVPFQPTGVTIQDMAHRFSAFRQADAHWATVSRLTPTARRAPGPIRFCVRSWSEAVVHAVVRRPGRR